MNYTSDDIKIISWPEPIRNRPSMYLKALGKEGCMLLFEEVLETILDDQYECRADEVEIKFSRHGEIIIKYSGRGMPIELSKTNDFSHPVIYTTMMTLSSGEFSKEDYWRYGHLVELGAIFNAVCKSLRITTVIDDKSFSLSFYKGCISNLLSENSKASERNSLRFSFDPEVMGSFEFTLADFEKVAEWA